MPDFVRVKSKETGAEFTIDRININDTVTVLDKPATGPGPLLPKPHVSLPKASPVSDGGNEAGQSGTKKEGLK